MNEQLKPDYSAWTVALGNSFFKEENTDSFQSQIAWEPAGFITEYYKEQSYDGRFEWSPRSTSSRLQHGGEEKFIHLEKNSLQYFYSDDKTVVAINNNAGRNFTFKQLKEKDENGNQTPGNFWVDPLALSRDGCWINRLGEEEQRVVLGDRKNTDVLILRLTDYPDFFRRGTYLDWASFLSFGQLLRRTACVILDVEPSELEVNIRPYRLGNSFSFDVFLMDTLENGAGYCKHFSSPKMLTELLNKSMEYLKGHEEECDASCYACLRDFGNSPYHTLLDWRLAFDLLSISQNGKDAWKDISLSNGIWHKLTEKVMRNLKKNLDDDYTFVPRANGSYYEIHDNNGVIDHLVHPLWTSNHHDLPKDYGQSSEPITIFDVLRRPGWCISKIQ